MPRIPVHRHSRILCSIAALGLLPIALPAPVWTVEIGPPPPAFTELKLTPPSLDLSRLGEAERVLVSGKTPSGEWLDVTRRASILNPSGIVSISEDGFIQAAGPGQTQLAVSVGHLHAYLPVNVSGSDSAPVSFANDVMPVLSKAGCNSGPCHGSVQGRNGFKLSLRGYDLEFDYHALVQDLGGRRFNRAKPEQSLILQKPTQGVPHKGGLIFDADSRYYRTIQRWIEEGVQNDAGVAPRVERLEIEPASPELARPGMEQQLRVIAHYTDGARRDVTREAHYQSSMTNVAEVSDGGLVTAMRRGETVILIRYEGIFETNSVLIMGDRSGFAWVETPELNEIDRLVYQKLRKLKILPAPVADDAEFLRRIWLDLTGAPPTPQFARTFINDPSPRKEKREALIDWLLDSPEHVEFTTQKWADLLQCNRKFLGEKGVWLYRQWIRDAIQRNVPYDRFVRDLVTASGSSYENPAANFYRVSDDPSKASENLTQLFLGVRFSCNKCHDHPFEKWTQQQYYAMGAFFSQVGLKNGQLPGETVVFAKSEPASLPHPKTGAPIPPSVPFGRLSLGGGEADYRRALAEWLTAPENPFFAKSTVNRVWSYFMGRGIIDPVDDIRASNPPSNPELLEFLTQDFIDSGFDMKHLMRTITRSRVYQHSIETNRWNEDDTVNFSHAVPRRLSAEQMLDAIHMATGVEPNFEGVPEGFRAIQLPDSGVEDRGFLKLFGRPERETSCECERTSEMSLSHALNLMNGPVISDAIAAPDGRIEKIVEASLPETAMVQEIYLAALTRLPTQKEQSEALAYLSQAESKQEGGQDLLWALLNSPAFLFNR